MDKPTLRDAVKHPEKMGPLGDAPEKPSDPPEPSSPEAKAIQEEAHIADREQLTTTD